MAAGRDAGELRFFLLQFFPSDASFLVLFGSKSFFSLGLVGNAKWKTWKTQCFTGYIQDLGCSVGQSGSLCRSRIIIE